MNNDDHHHHHYLQNQPPPNSNRRVMKQQENAANQIQPPAPQKCPRCDSTNTKFCYYNNYSLSQPRYFCKACRRYWTQGGNLRNVPVGGGCRKSKRPKPSSSSSSSMAPSAHIDHQISSTSIQSLAASSLTSSAAVTPPPSFLSQSFTGLLNQSLLHQNLRASADLPLLGGNSIPNLYPSSAAGGFFSPLGMVPQPLPPPQGGLVSGNDSFGGANLGLFQGMNFQNLKPGHVEMMMSTHQQTITGSQERNGEEDHRGYVGHQLQRRPLDYWAQGFINNAGSSSATATSSPPSAGFWNSGTANAGDNSSNQAGTSSSNLNQWSDSNCADDKNQGFDPSR